MKTKTIAKTTTTVAKKRSAMEPYEEHGPPPRMLEEFPEDSDRPTFRSDTIELAVLGKLRQFMSNERTKRAIRSEIDRRTMKAVTNASRIESQLADVRSKIARETQNLALAERADIPGISRLLARFRSPTTTYRHPEAGVRLPTLFEKVAMWSFSETCANTSIDGV